MRNRKLTWKDKFLMKCYEELLEEKGEVPTVEEVQQRYTEKYGNYQ